MSEIHTELEARYFALIGQLGTCAPRDCAAIEEESEEIWARILIERQSTSAR